MYNKHHPENPRNLRNTLGVYLIIYSNYLVSCIVIDPTHERAKGNVAYFNEEVKMYKRTGRRGDTGIITETKVKPRSERDNWHQTSSFQNYERLCRGEVRNLVSGLLILKAVEMVS